jgi:hypothetical protein
VETLKLNLLATNIPTPTIIVTPKRTPITIPAFAPPESPAKDAEDVRDTFFVWQIK